ncbi:choline sulfate utilization transcriptional regulator [Vibrio mangrovi]|uniref:Glycine cleavage system transcriptional activator n=1 Tax=Vibrio mangrovi TaxID=474394 RepID=A0A1Y6ISM5_9VIBR|nr:LysR substrate-binding domain-containing protein [Vibrio mangrovi]MDW6001350.1 LysR substrate-binding domain-containing protein [Vibrio mangrovi]SMS00628.1 Glycine cleavage system transcriptional activator [Vibrio mangrovi]
MVYKSDIPNLQTLVVFEASARLLSFTAAARTLNTTQSAVSQQMKALENELGVMLFRRIYRGVELTDEGQMLLETTQSSLNEIRDVLRKIKRKKAAKRIIFATDFAFASYWLMPVLAKFRQQYPEIDIRIETSQHHIDLVDSESDIAILFGDGNYQGYHSEKLLSEEVYPVYSPKLFSKDISLSSISALTSAPLLKLNADMGQKWMTWEGLFQAHHGGWSRPDSLMEFDNYTLVVQAAIGGQGVALGWAPLLDDFIASGVLVARKEFTLTSDRGYYMVTSLQRDLSPEVRTFVDWIKHRDEI